MNLKKLGAALVVVLLLSAVVVSSASAAAVAEAATWRTGSAGTVLSGSETETATGKGELVTAVGETPLVLKSTGLECLECTIKNEEGKATGTGKLRLTGVTVSSPAACAVNGGAITTVVIVFAHYYMNGVLWETRISVLSGATLATVSLVKGSGACPIAGTYNLTGNLFTRATKRDRRLRRRPDGHLQWRDQQRSRWRIEIREQSRGTERHGDLRPVGAEKRGTLRGP
jgi:hypothetical protein